MQISFWTFSFHNDTFWLNKFGRMDKVELRKQKQIKESLGAGETKRNLENNQPLSEMQLDWLSQENFLWLTVQECSRYQGVAVGPRPLAVQPCGHLQAAVLLPVGPAWSAKATLHVGRSPRVPLVGATGYTHTHTHTTTTSAWQSTDFHFLCQLIGEVMMGFAVYLHHNHLMWCTEKRGSLYFS